MRWPEALATALLAALAACGGDAPSHAPLPMALAPAGALAGSQAPAAIVPLGAGALALGADAVRTLDATGLGEVSDPSMRTWVAATPFATPAGAVVALAADADGTLWRLAPDAVENASGRYALSGKKVTLVQALGPGSFAAAADGGLYVIRDGQVTRHEAGAVEALGGGGDVVAYRIGRRVVRLDLAAGDASDADVPGATGVAVGAGGDVIVATGAELLRWHAGAFTSLGGVGAPIGDLRGFGGAVWFAAGTRVGRVDEHGALALSSPLADKGTVRLWLRLEGDGGWLLRSDELVRFTVGAGTPEDLWAGTIKPIYTQHCAKCHDGAERNLGAYAGWDTRREKIRTRVLMKKEMPPPEEPPLSAAELGAIESWLNAI